jgi:serine/threonine protein kinase
LALTAGTRLGAYEIIALIGEGGMGQVYRATDMSLGRQVAIKILPDAFAADADRVVRFEREAKTLASLNDSHIAGIYGFEKSAGLHALVMEFVEGEDLSQRIVRGAIPTAEALPIAKQIAAALEAAHELGIVHPRSQARQYQTEARRLGKGTGLRAGESHRPGQRRAA